MGFASETDLCSILVPWIEAAGWRVSEEVQHESGDRPDLVAERGPKVWAISCKLVFGLEVLEQCYRLHRKAHLVSAAVAMPAKLGTHARIRVELFGSLGIGVLFVRPEGGVQQASEPLSRTPARHDKIQTLEQHRSGKYAPAGSPGGGHHTQANETKLAVLEYIRANPRCGISAIVKNVAHHYGDDKRARHWIGEMLLRESAVEQRGKRSNASYMMGDAS